MAEIHTINVGGTNYTLSDSTKLPLSGGEITGDVYFKHPASLILNSKGGGIQAKTLDENTSYFIVQDTGGRTYFGNGGAITSLTGTDINLTATSTNSKITLDATQIDSKGSLNFGDGKGLYLSYQGGKIWSTQSAGTPLNLLYLGDSNTVCLGDASSPTSIYGTSFATHCRSTFNFPLQMTGNTAIITKSIMGTDQNRAGKYIGADSGGLNYYYGYKESLVLGTPEDEILTARILKSNFSEEFSVLPANPTVTTSGGTYTIGTIGGKTFTISFPAWGSGSNINTDTKNTAGSTNSTGTKLFLIGAKTQGSNPVTYSNSGVYINSSNQVEAPAFYATSDIRLKENIKEFIPQKSILDLPIVEFDFKDTKVHQIGCLAQDLQKICPEIVNIDDKGYLSINESKIIYLLLDEVKKLRREVDTLKGDN